MGLEHFPTANQISAFFRKPVPEPKDVEDILTGSYKTSTLLRLTPKERRQLRNFEKHLRKDIEGRRLFCTGWVWVRSRSQRMPSAQTRNAKVPFILWRE